MQRLNFVKNNKILGLLAVGISQTVVAGQYNVSKSTISRFVQRVNVTGTVDDRPRSGAPRVTSIRQDNLIRQNDSVFFNIYCCFIHKFVWLNIKFM